MPMILIPFNAGKKRNLIGVQTFQTNAKKLGKQRVKVKH
jgi:hypothetical protein